MDRTVHDCTLFFCVCVRACVGGREGGREGERERGRMCVCVHICVWDEKTECLNRLLRFPFFVHFCFFIQKISVFPIYSFFFFSLFFFYFILISVLYYSNFFLSFDYI